MRKRESKITEIIILMILSCMIGTCAILSLKMNRSGKEIYAEPASFESFLLSAFQEADFKTWIISGLLTGVVFAGLVYLCFGKKRIIYKLHKAKYFCAFGLIVLVTIFQINNTSLYHWTSFLRLTGAESCKPFWGISRGIRADEWSVWSPLTFSQQYSGFSSANNAISGGNTDPTWISVGGVPALSLAAVFKPFYWGFLLFGVSGGFSFLFACRIVLLFLTSYELAKEYTGKNHILSFTAALMITFSPYVQWWFSQSIAEILIFGQGIILFLLRSREADCRWKRNLFSIAAAYCAGCFLLVGYPSWLIGAGYLIVSVCILIIVKRKGRKMAGSLRSWVIPWSACICLLGLILWQSRETLSAVMNSVYPGNRLITGGGGADRILTDLYSAFYAFIKPIGDNASEGAAWISFAPAGILISAHNMYCHKTKDPLSLIMAGTELVFGWVAIIGIPAWLAQISLFSQVSRPELVIGIADTILLFRGLSRKAPISPLSTVLLGILFTVFRIAFLNARASGDYLLTGLLAGLYLTTYILLFICDIKKQNTMRFLSCFLIVIALIGGAFVNPLQAGTKCVEDLKIVQAIRNTGTENDLWFVEESYPITNLPLLAGKKTVNSTQVYANVQRWNNLDPDGTYEEVYNRFANISGDITEDKKGFFLIAPDHFLLSLSLDQLRETGIRYILTTASYTEDNQGIYQEAETDGYRIYRIQ